jgi:hypothetical protein
VKSSAWWVVLPLFAVSLLAQGAMVSAQNVPHASRNPKLRPASQAPALFSRVFGALAGRYRRSEGGLRGMVSRDRDLWIDDQARLVYLCEGAQAPAAAAAAPKVSSAADIPPYPLETTFQLHSRPTSSRKIYLDFMGHTTSGTWWNSDFANGADIVSAPFDQDNNPASLSAGELESIQDVWQRVAEDYAPFDIDVTTQDPGVDGLRRTSSGDNAFGVRVVISPTTTWYPGAGGVAYVGVFDILNTGADLPCFVFTSNLANNERYIAEAASHEAGHTLGLSHDGKTGGTEYYSGDPNGDWAPIMGVGYYKNVTQWSKGEYSGANNTEDDFAVIQANGGAVRADDYVNSIQGATALASGVAVNGVIEERTDKDFFKITTGAATLNLSAATGPRGPDVDIRLDLYDADGAVLQSSDPAGLPSTLSRSVAAGTYYVSVDGVGVGDPLTTGYSDYGSTGQYSLTATFSAAGSLTVTSPNGGESWAAGSSHNVTWSSSGVSGNVKLDYSTDGGSNWIAINANTANDGSEPWTVPNTATSQARVRITAVDNSASDSSNANFAITGLAASLTVTSPNGGESWTVGSSHNITWNSSNMSGLVKLEYFDGSVWSVISAGTTNDGSEPWTAPATPSSQARIRTTSVSAPSVLDQSDSVFSVVAAATPSVTLTAPNGGENWGVGTTQNITWSSSNFAGSVKLEYSTNAGSTWTTIISSTANDGSEAWTIPNAPSDQALVRISAVGTAAQDVSNVFAISAPAGDAYEPDDSAQTAKTIVKGETQARSIHAAGNPDWVKFVLGKKARVTLTTAGVTGGDTVIYLYKADGASLVTSNDNYKTGTKYSRIAGRSLAAGTFYVRVIGKSNSTISAYTLSLTTK